MHYEKSRTVLLLGGHRRGLSRLPQPLRHHIFETYLFSSLKRRLREGGRRVFISRVDHDRMPFWDAVAELSEEVEKLAATAGQISVIAKSYGGFVAYGLLARSEAARHIHALYTVSAAVAGTPDRAAAEWVRRTTGVTPALYHELRDALLLQKEKITILASRTDPIAPYEHCIIEGVHDIVDLAEYLGKERVRHHQIIRHSRVVDLLLERLAARAERERPVR